MHLGGHRRAYAPAENKLQVLANRGAENHINKKTCGFGQGLLAAGCAQALPETCDVDNPPHVRYHVYI